MLLVKNSVLNFVGQLVQLVVAFVAVPYIVHGLGVERFGVFSIAFVIVGYFGVFDMGLGRATTRFVAEALGKGEVYRVPTIFWLSVVFVSIFSLIGMAVLISLIPFLIDVLNIPQKLVQEAKSVFFLVSSFILTGSLTATLSAVFEAHQRFDLLTLLRIPSSILTYSVAVISVYFNSDLRLLFFLLVVKNVLFLGLYFMCCRRFFQLGKLSFSEDLEIALPLLKYGAWIAMHNFTVGILLYLDRFLVAALLTLPEVSYYTVPYELANRALIIPSSLVMALFPAFSSLRAVDSGRLMKLFIRALVFLVLLMGFVTGILVIFAGDLLNLWVGTEFVKESTTVLRLFALGVFLASIAWLCGTFLQGVGRPGVVTTIHVAQVPLYLLSTLFLINSMGIRGAALSWTLRVFVSSSFLLFECLKVRHS